MRSSIFSVPQGTAAVNYAVNTPDSIYAAMTLNIIGAVSTTTPTVNVTGGPTQTQMNAYVGATVTFFGGTATVLSVGTFFVNGSTTECQLTLSTATSTGTNISFPQINVPHPLPIGTTTIPLVSTAGLIVGDLLSGTGIASNTIITSVGTTVTASGATVPAVTISPGTTAAILNGATITEPTQPGVVVYPVDQYVAPVEISIQPIDVGGASVSVQATVLPLSEIDGPNATWGAYMSDGGSANLGSVGTINTYANKIVTAIRLSNSGSTAVRVSLAEGGIIS